ncbi:MAG: rhodanese-like domain-containing protein [Bacteroidetes bacterium]|jgi:rhodanese-related sulfurtransferase|nr:rhodanese-like domain-containing protein [Bacteroidota bacterium]
MNNILKSLNAGAIVVDVRTFAEYADGHLPGSINIPLNEIASRLSEFERQSDGLVVCCASGIRSNKAVNILKQYGIECVDGGSWLNLKHLTNLDK